MSNREDQKAWPGSFEKHREQQLIRMARDSTPAQRLEWAEEMLELMAKTGQPYHERKRQFIRS